MCHTVHFFHHFLSSSKPQKFQFHQNPKRLHLVLEKNKSISKKASEKGDQLISSPSMPLLLRRRPGISSPKVSIIIIRSFPMTSPPPLGSSWPVPHTKSSTPQISCSLLVVLDGVAQSFRHMVGSLHNRNYHISSIKKLVKKVKVCVYCPGREVYNRK